MRRTTAQMQLVNSIIGEMTRPHAVGKSGHNLEVTQEMVSRLGLTKELAQLKFVHVAGTKGKGSTCYATAQLLQLAGLKVGLFTSPHLIDVRERLMVNGRMLEQERFSKYFVDFQKEHDAAFDSKPWGPVAEDGAPADASLIPQKSGFFRFMFLLSLHVFAREHVDVVVLEVGVGGRLDSTNVVTPSVCGITALGLDHVDLLGNTVVAIAGEKAGIIKPAVPCFTSPQRDHPETLAVLQHAADAVGAPLNVVDESWYPRNDWSAVGVRGEHMVENSKLAVALSRTFTGREVRAPLSDEEMKVLVSSAYPGRSMVIPAVVGGVARLYLDGAHTPESMRVAAKWFFASSSQSSQSSLLGAEHSSPSSTKRDAVILFFTSRDAKLLLHELLPFAGRIKRLVFVRFPHTASTQLASITPQRLEETREAWHTIVASAPPELQNAAAAVEAETRVEPLESTYDMVSAAGLKPTDGIATATNSDEPTPILITGSLYLIGSALDMLRASGHHDIHPSP
jgi:folylpolyglutamate synthase